ncbi:APC family permease [Gluconacetobacter takamatsuzukensis]|uniref:APC family permease n=1 Tax=Gluconacetobacter takamatsuzukensis TaxID=1286190 RepID=A0A7W4KEM6_9PROT|nr:APC family permease [Gluconacetobacter takamatsuzukensis]MBB2205527.1 APC family permease [Gluconacetobacter takamatsuzukensis]
MNAQGRAGDEGFRQSLGLLDLTLIGFGSIFGSGWLFAAAHVATMAGPASILSWVVGGAAVLLLGLVYCELGAALPHAGGVVRYPDYSHGAACGFLMGLTTVIAFSSLIAIEIVAARQYAGAWVAGLTRDAAGDPTLAGWLAQAAVLYGLYRVNRSGIATFALVNNIVTLFKFCVPGLVAILLLAHLDPGNFTSHGFSTHGLAGVEGAISTGGIIFAYLGLTPIIAVASEVRKPQRTIPIALIASVLLSTLVYVLLQTAFIGAIPATLLADGWDAADRHFGLPFHDIALALGLAWLGALVVGDAILSPTGTGNIYMSSNPRVLYAWARGGTFFRRFARIDAASGVPVPALRLTFALSLFWTLPFPSWQALIGVVSSALMMSYALAPVTAAALRVNAPHMPRPFRVRGFGLLAPAAFVIATLIVYWTGWATLSWLLALQLVLVVAFLVVQARARGRAAAVPALRGAGWLLAWLAALLALSGAGARGGMGWIAWPADDLAVAALALAIYGWGRRSGLSHPGLSHPGLPRVAAECAAGVGAAP